MFEKLGLQITVECFLSTTRLQDFFLRISLSRTRLHVFSRFFSLKSFIFSRFFSLKSFMFFHDFSLSKASCFSRFFFFSKASCFFTIFLSHRRFFMNFVLSIIRLHVFSRSSQERGLYVFHELFSLKNEAHVFSRIVLFQERGFMFSLNFFLSEGCFFSLSKFLWPC